jgi:sirohydrochlorin ferrochelatase
MESGMNPEPHGRHPRIARIWRGRTTAARADEYARYLYEHGIRPLEKKALGVQMLCEDREGESEFVTISYWERGSDVALRRKRSAAHPSPGADAEFLIELPKAVQILEIAASSGRTG